MHASPVGLLAFEIEAHDSEIDRWLTSTIDVDVRLLTFLRVRPGEVFPLFGGHEHGCGFRRIARPTMKGQPAK